MLLRAIGAATALWLLWAGAMGAPAWFIVVLAAAWVAGFASGRTDRLTLFLLCLPLCWAWGVAWSTWVASESMCFYDAGRHWWPPYVDCEDGHTVGDGVEVGPGVFFGPFLAGVIAAGLLARRGNPVWRVSAGAVVTLCGVFAVFW